MNEALLLERAESHFPFKEGLSKVKQIGILLLFFLTLYFLLTTPFIQVMQFEQQRVEKGHTYYIKVAHDDQFQVVFTHSIHLTDVVETYAVEETEIRLLSMQYSDVAIGMPAYAEEGQTLIYEDGLYTLSYEDAILNNFNLYIGDVDHGLTFKYGVRQFDLKELLGRGQTYNLSIQVISLVDWWKGEKFT